MRSVFSNIEYRRFCVQCDAELRLIDYGKWRCPRCFGAGLVNGQFTALALVLDTSIKVGAGTSGASADGPPEPVPFILTPFAVSNQRNESPCGSGAPSFLAAMRAGRGDRLRVAESFKNRWRKNKPWAPPVVPSVPTLRVSLAEFLPIELRVA